MSINLTLQINTYNLFSLVAVLNAEDGFNKLAELSNTIELLVGSNDLFFYSNGGTQSSEFISLLFDKYPTVLNTSTLGKSSSTLF
jgi:hypothetical protein